MNPADCCVRWRWPREREGKLGPFAAASFVEWRYFAVLSRAFHGMVGVCLVNPERRFRSIAEGGLLVIIAGLVDRARSPDPATTADAGAELCWMHLFPAEGCRFDRDGPGALDADDGRCRVRLRLDGPAGAELDINDQLGPAFRLSH